MLLTREFRPKTINDVVGHQNIKKSLQAYLETNDCPHLMFIGPPGIGKNCLAYAFATEFFGREITINTDDGDPDYMELNASMDRGIDVVRDTIVPFMSRNPEKAPKQIIFLDEFDSMTYPAQLALKEPMEKNENRCVVILSLNNENGVKVDALHSRCAKFYFKSPTKKELIDYLLAISSEIGLEYESDEIPEKIVEYYGADIRHMLNDCLEALKGLQKVVTLEDLPKLQMEENMNLAQKVYNSEDPKNTFFNVWRTEAIDCRRFLEDFFKLRKDHSKTFAVVDRNIRNGGSEMIQMSYLFDMLYHQRAV